MQSAQRASQQWSRLNLFDFLCRPRRSPGQTTRSSGSARIDLKNSVSDCRPILKYLVLITATTFTLAGYCWNIIPLGLCSKGTSPLFNHGADGSRCRTQTLFFLFIWEMGQRKQTASDKDCWKIKRRDTSQPLIIQQLRLTEEFDLSLWWGWWIFELLIWFLTPCTCPPHQPTAALMNVHSVALSDTEMSGSFRLPLSTVKWKSRGNFLADLSPEANNC